MATVAFTEVIIKIPAKFKTAAIIIAVLGLKERVETHVAIAFGASVQPFTRITPRVSSETTKSGKLCVNSIKNSLRETPK